MAVLSGITAFLLALAAPTPAAAQTQTPPLVVGLEASEACVDFAETGGYPGSSWGLEDCLEVWEHFRRSVPNGLQRRFPDIDLWRDTGAELRRVGSPCLVASNPTSDGAGSSTIRHLATWIYSEQMGCDWVTPDWGKRRVANSTAVIYVSELYSVARVVVIDGWLALCIFSCRQGRDEVTTRAHLDFTSGKIDSLLFHGSLHRLEVLRLSST